MNSLSVEQILQFLDQQKLLQFTRGADIDDIQRTGFQNYQNLIGNNNMNGYCTAYNSGNSSTSSLRSSPTSSMLSSGPTSPLHVPPVQASLATIKKKTSNSKQSRAAHNELEKNRRANLRSYLDQIKDILPPEYDSSRDTTLSLLTRARNHIKYWRNKREQLTQRRNELASKNAKLRERIEKAKALRNSKRCRQVEQETQENVPNPVISQELSQSSTVATPVESPILMEFSPYSKPINSPNVGSNSGRMVTIDPYLEGLLPAVPLSYPYPYVQQRYNRSTVV